MRRRRESALRAVLAYVQKHIGERVADLARRSQHTQVVAITQHRAGRAKQRVDQPREARAERLHAVPELDRAVGFDHEVRVVRLDRVLDDAESVSRAKTVERSLDRVNESLSPERGESFTDLQRDERGMRSRDRRSAPMADARPWPRQSAGAGSSSAAHRKSELELISFYRPTH